jgi:hypothetical protein
MKSSRLVIPLVCMLAPAAAAQNRPAATPAPPQAPKAPPVEVRTSVSRTAVWIGDQVTYEVEFRCAPQVDILADDVAPERLKLDGVEVLGVEIERDASIPDQVVHRRRYRLATYRSDSPSLSVGEIPVRYFVRPPGQRTEDLAPAGEVRVPPLTLVFRSTLPDASAPAGIRDQRELQPLPNRMHLARPVGLTLVLLATAPVGILIIGLIRSARKARTARRKPQTRRQRRAALEDIKALDVSSPEDRRNAFARLDGWVRDNIQMATGVAAAALTSLELPSAVPNPPRAVDVARIQEVLGDCERAKYAPDVPPADRWPAALEVADQLLAADAR